MGALRGDYEMPKPLKVNHLEKVLDRYKNEIGQTKPRIQVHGKGLWRLLNWFGIRSKKQKLTENIANYYCEKHSAGISNASKKAIVYGEAKVKLTWDPEDGDVDLELY